MTDDLARGLIAEAVVTHDASNTTVISGAEGAQNLISRADVQIGRPTPGETLQGSHGKAADNGVSAFNDILIGGDDNDLLVGDACLNGSGGINLSASISFGDWEYSLENGSNGRAIGLADVPALAAQRHITP